MKFARMVRKRNPYMPIIMESQESANRTSAEAAGYVFLDKTQRPSPLISPRGGLKEIRFRRLHSP